MASQKKPMKSLMTLSAIATLALGTTAFAHDLPLAAVVLEDQHSNHTTMFVRPAESRMSVAFYAHGRSISNQGESRTIAGGAASANAQPGTTEYRSR